MEQIALTVIIGRMWDNQGIRASQHGFMKVRFHLINLISFYDQVISLVEEEKALDVIYLDFSKTFDCLPRFSPGEAGSPWFGHVHSLLGEKLAGRLGPKSCGELN